MIRKAHRIKVRWDVGGGGAPAVVACAIGKLWCVRHICMQHWQSTAWLVSTSVADGVTPRCALLQVSGSAPPPPLRSFAELDGRPGSCRRLLRCGRLLLLLPVVLHACVLPCCCVSFPS